jgi:cytochrome oxidase Cu insertion factor (SCO1/SenC/PrrC family)
MTFSRIMMFIAAMVVAIALGLTVNSLFLKGERSGTGTIGVAAIGGPFELVSHKGEVVRDTDYRGAYLLVMFGYTSCPDVCPTELQLITEAMEQLGPAARKVQPLMITIDPERDTAALLADYVSNFHPAIIALTGSVDQVKAAAKAYKVFFAKGEVDADGDYFMDHSSFIYLMSPDGIYLHHFAPSSSPEAMAQKIGEVMREG